MKHLAILALTVVTLKMAVPVQAQVDAKVEKELQASYQKIISLMKKKDAKGVMDMMTSDATMTENGQTMTRAQFEPMIKQQLAVMQIESASIKFSKLAAKGGVANSEYTELMTAKLPGQNGKTSTLSIKSKYKSIFKKVGDGWKLQKSETIGTPAVTIDGKPFTQPGAPQPTKN